MLKGKELGKAITEAIALMKERGLVRYDKDVAEHFGIKAPSLIDWKQRGTVAKDNMPELFRYFSQVAGPSHWGMTPDEWPAGLVNRVSEPRRAIYAVDRKAAYLTDDEMEMVIGYRSAPPDVRRFWLDQARYFKEIQNSFSGRSEQ